LSTSHVPHMCLDFRSSGGKAQFFPHEGAYSPGGRGQQVTYEQQFTKELLTLTHNNNSTGREEVKNGPWKRDPA
jgi:hypothetical protein